MKDDRFIIAHEFGHIVLHEGEAKGFAGIQPYIPTFYEDHASAEWQADTFARDLLVPQGVARVWNDADAVAEMCRVPLPTAIEAVKEFREHERRRCIAAYGAGLCTKCGNFSVDLQQGCLECSVTSG